MNGTKLVDIILDYLFPPRCAFCRKLLGSGEKRVCGKCAGSLPEVPESGRIKSVKFTDGCVAPLYYEGNVRESLLRYKFGGIQAYSRVYGEILAKCIDECKISCDIITWVPLSRKRLRKRGYDQAMLIAQETAKRLGVPCERMLDKIRNTPAQSSISDAEKRGKNVGGVYACHGGTTPAGKRILIIDDIVTTGSTIGECARVLRFAGAGTEYAAAVACGKR